MPDLYPHLRWAVSGDMPQVMRVERASYDEPWDEKYFLSALRDRTVIMMVAELGPEIAGYVVYQVYKTSYDVLNLAVAPDRRRSGIATMLLRRVVEKAAKSGRGSVTADAHEGSTGAHLFLRAAGMRAVRVTRNVYPGGESAYTFEKRLTPAEMSEYCPELC